PATRARAAGRALRARAAALHADPERADSSRRGRAAGRPDPGAAAESVALQSLRGPAGPRVLYRHRFLQPGAYRHQDPRDGARARVRAPPGVDTPADRAVVRLSRVVWQSPYRGRRPAGMQGEGRRQDRGWRARVRRRPRRARPAGRPEDHGRRPLRRPAGGAGSLDPLLSPGRAAKGGGLKRGCVSFVGAGPGDPQRLTVKGLRRLREADVVLHDRLIPRELLDEVGAGATIVDVGKAPGRACIGQGQINWLLVDWARRSERVVRLKGGDPAVFGRLSEEI